ncbi:MAG: rRNA ((2251)-2-O)-methyltransferase RlmB [Clostridia bacterium]|nr:rRNA ((2251)-2-O)-methyltransferase RlmB [Clostridia bacterium]
MKEIIASSQNKHIKHVRSLHAKKHRDQLGQYIIEGYKLIEEALDYNKCFDLLLLSESALKSSESTVLMNRCAEANIPVYLVEEKLFLEVSEMDTPQGVLAVLHKQEQELHGVIDSDCFHIVILDEVRDPGNVGTIIRTADACGINVVVLSSGCVDLYNSKTLRATMGSIFHIPVITDVDIIELIGRLKTMGADVLGADPHSNISCIDAELHQRTAIVIGNEAKGLREEVKKATTQNITIPMPGKAESLNAGIAAAILMYEFAVRKVR